MKNGHRFKVGDRVVLNKHVDGKYFGATGIVVSLVYDNNVYDYYLRIVANHGKPCDDHWYVPEHAIDLEDPDSRFEMDAG